MAFFTDDISINTILGENSFFKDEIKIDGNVRIYGNVDGNINATGKVFIGEKARIRGDINALSAEIFGIVLGDVNAPTSVKIMSSAAVIGDVTTKEVQIEEDAIFKGHCISHKDEAAFEKAKTRRLNEKAVLSSISTSINGGL